MNTKQLIEVVERLFKERLTYVQLLQTLAENFYPERADFTIRRTHGNEFAADLMTSYPILTRRDLGDQISSMLRPVGVEWFKMIPAGGEKTNIEGQRWLDNVGRVQRRAMFSRAAQFVRATKEGDQDFAAFGQNVISCRMNRLANGLIYRNWHLRDVVWQENAEGAIGLIARTWKATARDLTTLFKSPHDNVKNVVTEDPFKEFKCYHFIIEADMYDGDAQGKPYFSVYYDVDNEHELEATPVWNMEYNIARWQTVSGSQYAYSPASITALPDARLIQAQTYALLEAGEKATNPPLIATTDVVRSDVSIYAGGITWVDSDYDERLGAALRPISQDFRGLPFGEEQAANSRAMISQAFYLNKLNLPDRAPEMTAYEVGQRIQEYIRGALPIFQPMEHEYNGGLCELTFDILMRNGAFGSPRDIPSSLGTEIDFEFQSPLHDAMDAQKGQKFLESKALLAEAATIDETALYMLDAPTALRDALTGIGTPAEWIHTKDEVDATLKAKQKRQTQQQALATMQQGADVAATLGEAKQSLGEAAI